MLVVAAYAFVSGLSKFTTANARHNLDDFRVVHVYLHGDFHPAICGRSARDRGCVFPQCAGGDFVSATDHARWLVKHAHAKAQTVFPARSDKFWRHVLWLYRSYINSAGANDRA